MDGNRHKKTVKDRIGQQLFLRFGNICVLATFVLWRHIFLQHLRFGDICLKAIFSFGQHVRFGNIFLLPTFSFLQHLRFATFAFCNICFLATFAFWQYLRVCHIWALTFGQGFFGPLGKKKLFMLFLLILGIFWCSVLTSVPF